jgi:hypothetical protein
MKSQKAGVLRKKGLDRISVLWFIDKRLTGQSVFERR